MAGSFNHIVDDQGAFTMETIENMGDAHEALENCFDVIALLIQQLPPPFRKSVLRDVCERASSPTPQVLPVFHTRAKEPTFRPKDDK